jgi:calcium-dependent protein kinase
MDETKIKIIDFGAAIQWDCNDRSDCHAKIKGGLVGTVDYCAPEVISGEYNEKCDIWSLGCIAYSLLSRSVPFAGESKVDILKSICDDPVGFQQPVWAEISEPCKDFILKLLEKDPTKRLSAAEAL